MGSPSQRQATTIEDEESTKNQDRESSHLTKRQGKKKTSIQF
jgi:hypothetical protein